MEAAPGHHGDCLGGVEAGQAVVLVQVPSLGGHMELDTAAGGGDSAAAGVHKNQELGVQTVLILLVLVCMDHNLLLTYGSLQDFSFSLR